MVRNGTGGKRKTEQNSMSGKKREMDGRQELSTAARLKKNNNNVSSRAGASTWSQTTIWERPRDEASAMTSPPPTFVQQVGDVGLILVAHPDLALVGQQGLLLGVVHQRVEEGILGEPARKGGHLDFRLGFTISRERST